MERWYAWQFLKTVSLAQDEISFCFQFMKRKKGVLELRNQILKIKMKEASIKVYDTVLAYMRKIIPTKSDQFPNFMNKGNYEVKPDSFKFHHLIFTNILYLLLKTAQFLLTLKTVSNYLL